LIFQPSQSLLRILKLSNARVSVFFNPGNPGLQGLWVQLASVVLQSSQPLLRIFNLREAKINFPPESEEFLVTGDGFSSSQRLIN